MIGIGSRVKVLPPFDSEWGGVWVVNAQNPDTGAWQIDGGVDFDESNLEEVVD